MLSNIFLVNNFFKAELQYTCIHMYILYMHFAVTDCQNW